ncbi:MAG: hypothetical protein ABIO04_09840 [Ferruginibacter sp.]
MTNKDYFKIGISHVVDLYSKGVGNLIQQVAGNYGGAIDETMGLYMYTVCTQFFLNFKMRILLATNKIQKKWPFIRNHLVQ